MMLRFKKVYIEITNGCNLSCSFCKASARPIRQMTPAEFEYVLAAIKPYTDFVYLHVLGEPLTHPSLGFFLDACGYGGIHASITTNATLLGRRKSELSHKPALRQMNYSLHGLLESDYDTEHTIEVIADWAREEGRDIYHCLRLWNLESGQMERNLMIMEILRNAFKDYADGQWPSIDRITVGNGVKIAPNVFLQQQRRFVWPSTEGEQVFMAGRCGGLQHDVGILSDGRVVPCCLDGEGVLTLGNIFNESMADILSNPLAKAIRKGFDQGHVVEPFCRTCGFAGHLFGKKEA